MSDIYLTGDCHGDFMKFSWFVEDHKTTKKDIMICLGDVGLNYYLNRRDKKNKEKLQNLPLTFICIQGNHEKYARNIVSYEEIVLPNEQFENIKGRFYYEPEFPNLLFAVNGERYEINGHSFLVLGGAYSIDKYYRLMNGWNWFEDEQMTEDEKNDVLESIKNYKDWQSVDYILAHTCPFKYQPRHLFLGNIDQSTVDNSMEYFLQDVEEMIDYKHFFCGHFHATECLWDKGYMFYIDIKNLKDFD